jgi:hypothetical protein
MLPAAIGEDEVEEAMRQRLARDGHAQLGGVGEVRQGHAARLGRLSEDHVPLRAVQGAPVADPALERSANTVVREGIRIGHLEMPQTRHRLDGGVALEDRHEHRLPDRLERIGNGAAPVGLALRRWAGIRLEATGSTLAEPCSGGCATLAVMTTVGHVDSHLLVGDGDAWHGRISVWLQRPRPYRPAAASTPHNPPG